MNVQPTSEHVDAIFEQYSQTGSPGCAMAIIKDGEITGLRVSGSRVRHLWFARLGSDP